MAGKPKARSQRDVQRVGTLIAVGVGMAFVGVLGWYITRGGGGGPVAPVQNPDRPKQRPAALEGDGSGELMIGEGERWEVPVMDRKDRRKQVGMFTCDTVNPLEGHHYEAVKPQVWLYLEDGRMLHIAATTGKLYMPDRQKEPESGTLAGGVKARLFEAKEDGAKIDEAKDAPSLTFESQTFAFDSTLGKGSTPDRVTIKSEIADFTGHGLEVLVNQVRQRLEHCRIGAGENEAVFHTGAGRRKTTTKPAAAATPVPGAKPATATAAGKPATSPPPPLETLYGIRFDDGVRLSQAGRLLEADQLRLWTRLVDGKLPADAIAEIRGQAANPAPTPAASPGGATRGPAATGATPSPAPTVATNDIRMTWTGECVITPLEVTPPELKGEHLVARFAAEKAGAVKLSDAERKASGEAAAIEYGATTGRLVLDGSESLRPRLTFPAMGTVRTARIEGNLVNGVIHLPAGGELRDDDRGTLASWNKQADFTLATAGGGLTSDLVEALLDGDVRMSEKDRTLTAAFARAVFRPSTSAVANNLSRLVLSGGASADWGGDGQRLSAETIDAAFDPPATRGGEPEPRIVTATGAVSAARTGSLLKADWLEAHLARNAKGAVDVASARARGSVAFTREADQIVAKAQEIDADLSWAGLPAGVERRQLVTLLGAGTSVSRGGVSTMTGEQLRMDGVAGAVESFGPGTFKHDEPGKAVVEASWHGGMMFSDSAGTLECFGDAKAVSTPSALARDEVVGERINLWLKPNTGAKVEAGATPEDRLLRAEAIGSVREREGGVNAMLTSERFIADAAAPDGRRREQLQYLEGPIIKLDNVQGTMDVPAAGKLVIVDRRMPLETRPSSAPTGDARGDTLFTWTRSLHAERGSGRADMDGDVRMTHRSADGARIINLDCTHLTAIAHTAEGTAGGLKSATATGAVLVTMGPERRGERTPPRKELVADRVEYDAAEQTIEAAANPGSQVSYLDPAKASSVSAAGLFWNLATDRVEIRNLSPVVAPVIAPR